MSEKPKPTGLSLLREPFPAHQISKLPKPTKQQTESLRAALERRDFSLGIKCQICGTYHHKDVIHLDYVGHAALTDRLLDADPNWNWEPVTDNGFPKLDANNGMWIKLTVCGVTRLGYGHAEGKKGGDAIKEVIGDALRNAAMRFGAALDLWHKGDLHGDEEPQDDTKGQPQSAAPDPVAIAVESLGNAATLNALAAIWKDFPTSIKAIPQVAAAKDARKDALKDAPVIANDEIPY